MSIQSWDNEETKAIFEGRAPRKISADLAKAARRKLAVLDAAERVEDLQVPPSNRLQKIAGGKLWSISVNMQYRITFRWNVGDSGPEEVWFGDYH